MGKIPFDYMERVYAGWLGKIIGIRLGAAIEGWTYQKIKDTYGELDHYPADYINFAADDDSNGPLFYLRALEDCRDMQNMTAQDVGEALLNYAPYEHGFFWWGGYGTSTEHTAYLNLRAGIKAPLSGSIELNGATVAEQIGGQIFIDTWGLVSPGNPAQAAKLAREAASATHGGNGVYGGMFVAALIAQAFVERDMDKLLQCALSYIPEDCEYARAVHAVMDFHAAHPENWRDCFQYIFENFGYDRYPGACHIIPNISVMILALLYGAGDFDRTINICNMCGWDTDCNVGNVGCLMGVLCGAEGIDFEKWRAPIGDLLICSSVVGSLNIMDLPFGASYIAKLAYRLAGEEMPAPFAAICEERIDSCHFEYPGSTHVMRLRGGEGTIANSDAAAHSGKRSLKVEAKFADNEPLYLYKKTYYYPQDFSDSRYDPSFSPLLYPGQSVEGFAMAEGASSVRLYVRDGRTGRVFTGEAAELGDGQWKKLTLKIPFLEGALIDEAGFLFAGAGALNAYVDDLAFLGGPHYTVDFRKETKEDWTWGHKEISQFTRLKGLAYLAEGALHLSCADFGECYTGRHDFRDYEATFTITPVCGLVHTVNVRVQGAMRSYAFGFAGENRLALLKNENGYRTLCEARHPWRLGETYQLRVKVSGKRIEAALGDVQLTYIDGDGPYLTGGLGLSVRGGSHLSCQSIAVE